MRRVEWHVREPRLAGGDIANESSSLVGNQVRRVSFVARRAITDVPVALALAFGLAGRDLARDLLVRLASRAEPGAGDERRQL